MKKRFIVRKYIMAKSAKEAMKLDKSSMIDEVFVDSDWLIEHDKKDDMGFKKKK